VGGFSFAKLKRQYSYGTSAFKRVDDCILCPNSFLDMVGLRLRSGRGRVRSGGSIPGSRASTGIMGRSRGRRVRGGGSRRVRSRRVRSPAWRDIGRCLGVGSSRLLVGLLRVRLLGVGLLGVRLLGIRLLGVGLLLELRVVHIYLQRYRLHHQAHAVVGSIETGAVASCADNAANDSQNDQEANPDQVKVVERVGIGVVNHG